MRFRSMYVTLFIQYVYSSPEVMLYSFSLALRLSCHAFGTT